MKCDQRTRYHDFQTIQDTAEAKVEVCQKCHERLITTKDSKEHIDNRKYAEMHAIDMLPPEFYESQKIEVI